MLFHVTATHTPENCPIYHPETQQRVRESAANAGQLAQDLGVTIRFNVTAAPDHVAYMLLEADSYGAISRFLVAVTPFPSEFAITPVADMEEAMRAVVPGEGEESRRQARGQDEGQKQQQSDEAGKGQTGGEVASRPASRRSKSNGRSRSGAQGGRVNPIQVQKHLKGVDYPASKADLLKHVEASGADENLRATIERLPDETFETPADVSQAIGRVE